MAALAKNTQRTYELGEDMNELPVKTATKIFEGSVVGIDSSIGYARPLVAGDDFVGFADREADNTDGANGDIVVPLKTKGRVQLPVSSAAISKINDGVYASDSNTFTLTASGNSLIGYIRRFISGTTCIVQLKVKEG